MTFVLSRISSVCYNEEEGRQLFMLRDHPLSVWLPSTRKEAEERLDFMGRHVDNCQFRWKYDAGTQKLAEDPTLTACGHTPEVGCTMS